MCDPVPSLRAQRSNPFFDPAEFLDCFVAALLAMTAGSSLLKAYSITAWSGAADWLRKVALVEPIMIASGIAHSVTTITSW
jgi:hypothetical protein